MKDTIRLKTHNKETLLKYDDDGNKAIDALIEENKTLKTQVALLQGITVGQTMSQTATQTGFSTANNFSPTAPTASYSVTHDTEYWKRFKTEITSSLEGLVGKGY